MYDRLAVSARGSADPLAMAIAPDPVMDGVPDAAVGFHVAVSDVTDTPGSRVTGAANAPVICEATVPPSFVIEPWRSSVAPPMARRRYAVTSAE